jgi:hypothetical protein
MLATTGTPSGRAGSFSRTKTSMPTFSRPMAFNIPDAVSKIRGGRLPWRGSRVRLLATKPPIRRRSRKGANSVP